MENVENTPILENLENVEIVEIVERHNKLQNVAIVKLNYWSKQWISSRDTSLFYGFIVFLRGKELYWHFLNGIVFDKLSTERNKVTTLKRSN